MNEASPSEPFDLLLRGGRVFDPLDDSFQRADIAIRGDRIAAVAADLSEVDSRLSVDLDGLLVTTGLIDLHVHAYSGATYWGIDVDAVSLRSGVTTAVDAGSAGAHTFAGLAPILRESRLDARAFLNIAATGLAAPFGELLTPEAADIEAAVRVARENPDLIVGLKLRASPNTVGDNASHALAALRQAADELNLPVMVHVSESPPDLAEVLQHLRAGDVLTHCFTPYGNGVINDKGEVRDEVRHALQRGVLLDVGHGSGSFSFRAARAYNDSGLPIPIISSDLHAKSVLGPAFDLTTVMTKMLASGFRLAQVLRAVSVEPTKVVGQRAVPGGEETNRPSKHPSCLAAGAPADMAVLDLEDRELPIWDSRGNKMISPQRLNCRMTVRNGRPVFVDRALRLEGR